MPGPLSLPPSALALMAAAGLLLVGCHTQQPTAEPIRPAIVVQPTTANAESAGYFSGEVRARQESQLAFRVPGKVRQRHVDIGARVEAGQVLATLDPSDLRLDLEAAQAVLTSARADLDLARSEQDRHAALLERQLVSASQFESQRTALAAAQARLEQAQAQLSIRRNHLAYAQLKADRTGVVTAVRLEAGQVVAAGQTGIVLALDHELEVEIALPESQAHHYQPGASAHVTLWPDSERHYQGRIREIAPDSDPGSRTYRARVAIENADATVQLGRTARVRFQREGNRHHLSIPLSALHVLDEKPAVWRVDPATHTVTLKPVQIDRYREDRAEIGSGLGTDEWLVAAGVHLLHAGQQIRPIDRDNRPVEIVLPR